MEAAEVMSLPEGRLIVFSRGLRHIVQDSRTAVLHWLPLMPDAPKTLVTAATETPTVQPSGEHAEARAFW